MIDMFENFIQIGLNFVLDLFSNLSEKGRLYFAIFQFDVICYCSSKNFFIFDGNDWNIDDKHQIRACTESIHIDRLAIQTALRSTKKHFSPHAGNPANRVEQTA